MPPIRKRTRLLLRSDSDSETRHLGETLAQVCSGNERILIEGDLGVGKTVFIKGIARGLEVAPDRVRSPSYVTAFVYPGKIPLLHMDLYRRELTPQDLIEDLQEFDGIVAVEWGERAAPLLSDYLRVRITMDESGKRTIEVRAVGKNHRAVLRRWMKSIGKSSRN
ncbi:MAG: tRNA (adenosine(37)-N6)-threonylcarbamoyltransferase complex ATPase subunit type 1 TsaE [bacterium JZ-2024 1]